MKLIVRFSFTFIVHDDLQCPFISENFIWPIYMQYDIWIHNHIPNVDICLQQYEPWTGTKSFHSALFLVMPGESPHMLLVQSFRIVGRFPIGNPIIVVVNIVDFILFTTEPLYLFKIYLMETSAPSFMWFFMTDLTWYMPLMLRWISVGNIFWYFRSSNLKIIMNTTLHK